MKWSGSSTRENNRLKSGMLGEILTESPNSNLPHSIPKLLDVKGVELSYNDLKRGLKIPNLLDESLAEDIGIQIGDGWISNYDQVKRSIVGCCGNRIEDRIYFERFVIPLKRGLFNLSLNLKENRLAGTCYIKFGSKGIVNFYTKTIGLNPGKKSNIPIPKIILESPREVQLACIRGIADTDFSLSFKRDFKGVHRDPYIKLVSASSILVEQVKEILDANKLNNTAIFNFKKRIRGRDKVYTQSYIAVHGKKNLEKWISLIGFHNPVQITRYLVWKEFGFCPPKTNLEQRIKVLEGELPIQSLVA